MEIDPRNADTLYNLGFLHFRLGKEDEALKYLHLIENKTEDVLDLIEIMEKGISPERRRRLEVDFYYNFDDE